jgi:hypothetical protein
LRHLPLSRQVESSAQLSSAQFHEIMTDSEERIEEEATSLERTIDLMSESNACFHPIHYHSFQGVSFMLPLRNCAGCGQRLQPGVFRSYPVVRCVACKQFAHRSCGLSTDMAWKEVCPVNSKISSGEDTVTTETVIGEQHLHLEYEPDLNSSGGNNEEEEVAQQPEEEELLHDNDSHSISLVPEIAIIAPAPKNAFALLNLLRFRELKVEESFDTPSTKLEKETLETEKPCNLLTSIFRREVKAEESSSDTSSTKLEQETIETEKSDSLLTSIFRPKPTTTTTTDAPEKRHVPPANMFRAPSADSCDGKKVVKSTKATFPFLSAVKLLPSYSEDPEIDGASIPFSSSGVLNEDMDSKFNWTADGPPAHFAVDAPLDQDTSTVTELTEEQHMVGKSLELYIGSQIQTDDAIPLPTSEQPTEDGDSDGEAVGEKPPLHFARHPFMSVSRALQDNIIATFRPVVGRLLTPDDAMKTNVDDAESSDVAPIDSETDETSPHSTGLAKEEPKTTPATTVARTTSVDSQTPSEAEVEGLLDETPSKEAVERAASRRRLGLVTVAGGIAGGMAGLIFAGPVGGVIGAKCGQTAGILGVFLEGSVSIGVLASGIAAGKYTGQQLQDKLEERRVLAVGHGTHRRVLLIRPTVQIDPAWSDIYAEARRTHDDQYVGLSLSNILPNGEKQAKRERYEREFDIVKTDEDEIPTADKVLLLVSRILNDKASLPGHVYRHLLTVFRERCEQRGPLIRIARNDTAVEDEANDEAPVFVLDPYRGRRQDAHAVIKYVTASLLEVRPGFAAAPSITELTASAVESLVFGEVYDLVIEEIEAEYEERDDELLSKIAEFDRHRPNSLGQEGEDYREFISESALGGLHQLPQAHSAVDKLRYCVTFLECISDHFSSYSSKSMGADSLLKMVCQHILVAKVFALNAQIAFLEEFARDEQLLRGREGYALVTLQASLHFLNLSQDFENDIFSQHDDE